MLSRKWCKVYYIQTIIASLGWRSCNGRRLTALTYLNDSWQHGDGGELRVYGRDGEKIMKLRLLQAEFLFWSDFRVPHEVFTHNERFAITLWYFDKVERDRALSSGVTDTEEGKMTDNVHNKGEKSVPPMARRP